MSVCVGNFPYLHPWACDESIESFLGFVLLKEWKRWRSILSLLNHQSRDGKLLSLTRRSSTALSWTSVLSTASNVAQSITWFGFSLVRNTTWSFNPWKLGGFLASCHLRSMDHRISLETFGKLSHVRTKFYVIFFTKANIIKLVSIFFLNLPLMWYDVTE